MTYSRLYPKLYPKILGNSWQDLHVTIQRLHTVNKTVHAAGVFSVSLGHNKLARALARIAQLPTSGESVNVTLQITMREENEVWKRTFNGHPLVSLESERGNGLLLERIGIVEISLRLKVIDGVLNYNSVRAALRFGFIYIPLPSWLSPCIIATEKGKDDLSNIDASVNVSIPLIGQLITYNGTITLIESEL